MSQVTSETLWYSYIAYMGTWELRISFGYVSLFLMFPCLPGSFSLLPWTPYRWLGTQKLSDVDLRPKQDRSTLNHHAHTCICHRIQLAVGDMTMNGWKPTISLIPHPLHEPQRLVMIFKTPLALQLLFFPPEISLQKLKLIGPIEIKLDNLKSVSFETKPLQWKLKLHIPPYYEKGLITDEWIKNWALVVCMWHTLMCLAHFWKSKSNSEITAYRAILMKD